MRPFSSPAEVYSRIDLDARIEGAGPDELNRICFDALIESLGRAAMSRQRGDRSQSISAINRALTVIAGLQRAVDGEAEMGAVLVELYSSYSKRLRQLLVQSSGQELLEVRADMIEIADALVPQMAGTRL